MIWHIWSFVLVVIAGILLSVATNKGEGFDKPKLLYITYECIIIMLWACELPFIYIINKVINQAYVSKKHREQLINDDEKSERGEDVQDYGISSADLEADKEAADDESDNTSVNETIIYNENTPHG